jgi:hypothetical protein
MVNGKWQMAKSQGRGQRTEDAEKTALPLINAEQPKPEKKSL